MESSRDGAGKRLNGHGSGAIAEGSLTPPQPQLSGLVDELAQAMGLARESLERSPAAGPRVPVTTLPAIPTVRHLFDDEDDDAAVPIPSTWRNPPEPPKEQALRDQLRAAALGFGTGLSVIVPLVLLLTGRLDDVSLSWVLGTGRDRPQEAVISAQLPMKVQQRPVSTAHVVPAPETAATPVSGLELEAASAPATSQPQGVTSRRQTILDARARIVAGDVRTARRLLERPAEEGDPDAMLTLAETYDPNMLAAWGVLDLTADVGRARGLYERAFRAGVEPAGIRLQGLQ